MAGASTRHELADGPTVDWMISDWPVDYAVALDTMARRTTAIRDADGRELVWLLEHPALYTAGTSAHDADLLKPGALPVHKTGRGGQFTYHGPGQRVAYVMLDLKRRDLDVRTFVRKLEAWIIGALAEFNVRGETRPDRVGVWVVRPSDGKVTEDKIAAIGLRVSRWVSSHGISINVDPDLAHYDAIVPCGIREHGVTSLMKLGLPVTVHDVDVALKRNFEEIFGPVRAVDLRSLIAPREHSLPLSQPSSQSFESK